MGQVDEVVVVSLFESQRQILIGDLEAYLFRCGQCPVNRLEFTR